MNEGLKIGEINSTVYEKLCLELNKSVPLKDYVALAGTMEYSSQKVKTFKLSSNPADALLCDWSTEPGNDVRRLVSYLRIMGRDDLVKLLEESTDKTGKRAATKLENKDGQIHHLSSDSQFKIGEINSTVYERLCLELNKSIPLKDYTALAGVMEYSSEKVKTFKLSSNPADALLSDWTTGPGNDVFCLVSYLGIIGRNDLVKLLEECIYKTGVPVNENQNSNCTKERASETNNPEVNAKKVDLVNSSCSAVNRADAGVSESVVVQTENKKTSVMETHSPALSSENDEPIKLLDNC